MQTDSIFDLLFDKQREKYLHEMRDLFSRFMQRPKQLKTNLFTSFTSWPDSSFEPHQALFSGKKNDVQEGGYFLSVQGVGICINPSQNFFEELCQSGFSLHDIDVVIATSSHEPIKEAIKNLHSLGRECSRTLMSYGQDPHIIRYFLHPDLYTALSSHCRPIIREEVGTILSLETFTKTIECRSLADGVQLFYCNAEGNNLAMRIDCQDEEISFGLISSGGFNDSVEELFSTCSIIACGIGNCSSEDLEKLQLQKQSLGYYGLYKLIKSSCNLEIVLVSEFARSMGDCRLELVKKLRSELDCTIIPIDSSFSLQLDARVIETENGSFSTCNDVRVLRPDGAYGRLLFLGSEDTL
ncbi:MAG: hypothetical protein JSR37_07260 [Verrucomicrobia bacterium]|nr:hypothetical protein [Verrucomicrobiota bacterium]MBS0636607.1 hypothetical protein [Verrucomicrobiota bacterium]